MASGDTTGITTGHKMQMKQKVVVVMNFPNIRYKRPGRVNPEFQEAREPPIFSGKNLNASQERERDKNNWKESTTQLNQVAS